MSGFDQEAYDPPLASRRRSSSFSAASAAPPVFAPRRQSTLGSQRPASLPPSYHDDTSSSTDGNSDDDGVGEIRPKLTKLGQTDNDDADQDPIDAAMDYKNIRPGRMSKGQEPLGTTHSGDMENFLAQLYDLTHAIDALDNDIDDLVALRKKIGRIHPKEDIGQVSIKADLDSLAHLTTDSGKTILSLETWLTALYNRNKTIRALVKKGQANYRPEEIGEIKFQISSAKLDFADAMERIRDEAWKEQERRQRIRMKMARHIRHNEPEISDRDVKALLKAAELGAAEGIANNDTTSYAGMWALHNPFTELAELTNGMRFLHDDLDREIVDQMVPDYSGKRKNSTTKTTKSKKEKAPPAQPVAFFGSRLSYFSAALNHNDARVAALNKEIDHSEADIEYGFAQQKRLERSVRRKKLIIALLLTVIIGLILLVFFATMSTPSSSSIGNQTESAQDNETSTTGGNYWSSKISSIQGYTSLANPAQWTSMQDESDPTSYTTTSSQSTSSSSSTTLTSLTSLTSGSSATQSGALSGSTSSTSSPSGSGVSSTTSGSSSSTVWWTPPTSTDSVVWWTQPASSAPAAAPTSTHLNVLRARRSSGRWE